MPVVSVTLRSLDPTQLRLAAIDLFGNDPFFDGEAAALDLSQIEEPTPSRIAWHEVAQLFLKHGLNVIGVTGGTDALRANAKISGLPAYEAFTVRSTKQVEIPPVKEEVPPPAPIMTPPPPAEPVFVPTMIIDRPLRSGQQVYARGGDLVVLAAVNPGAEVIADGSIHIYAPLRGRALAGASGSTQARIFTTRFEAELVSIAGVYRTFEAGFPNDIGASPVQVSLKEDSHKKTSQLSVVALKTD